jgi:hypothetical protein
MIFRPVPGLAGAAKAEYPTPQNTGGKDRRRYQLVLTRISHQISAVARGKAGMTGSKNHLTHREIF